MKFYRGSRRNADHLVGSPPQDSASAQNDSSTIAEVEPSRHEGIQDPEQIVEELHYIRACAAYTLSRIDVIIPIVEAAMLLDAGLKPHDLAHDKETTKSQDRALLLELKKHPLQIAYGLIAGIIAVLVAFYLFSRTR